MFFTSNLEYLQKEQGSKNKELFGEVFGLTRNVVYSYFSGTTPPTIDFLLKLKEKYNLSIDSLLLDNFTETKPLHKYISQNLEIPASEYIIGDARKNSKRITSDFKKDDKPGPEENSFKNKLLNIMAGDADVQNLILAIIKEKL